MDILGLTVGAIPYSLGNDAFIDCAGFVKKEEFGSFAFQRFFMRRYLHADKNDPDVG